MICGHRGSKSRPAKAAGVERLDVERLGEMSDEKLHTSVARSAFASEKLKALPVRVRSTFGS